MKLYITAQIHRGVTLENQYVDDAFVIATHSSRYKSEIHITWERMRKYHLRMHHWKYGIRLVLLAFIAATYLNIYSQRGLCEQCCSLFAQRSYRAVVC